MKTLFTLLLLLNATFLSAQSSNAISSTRDGLLSGRVLDVRQQPVSFATVVLRSAEDSSVVKTALADAGGMFRLAGLRAGRYVAQVSAVGFATYQSAITTLAEGENTTLPDVVLTEAARSLDAVTVKATKPLVDVLPDKLVLNVQSSLTAAGISALELLQRAPGVLLDPNDNLILQGKNGVRIYIDGKLSPLTATDLGAYLRTLQASDIEAVEIITQPSARFDAAGNAGIINIRLKKNRNFGTNGNVALGLAQGRYFPKANGSLSLNHRTKAVNVFATYSHRAARDWSFINLYREQSNQFFDQRSETRAWSAAHNARLGADWFLSKRSTFGVLLDGNGRDADGQTAGRTPIGTLGQSGDALPVATLLLANNNNVSQRRNGNANLNYRYVDTLGRNGELRELNVDADYGRFRSNSNAFQPNRYVDPATGAVQSARDYRMTTLTDITLKTLKADYRQPFAGGKLSVGFKVSSVKTGNDFRFYDVVDAANVLDPDRSNRFIYTEDVNAAYAQFEKKQGKWQTQAGLRIEQTYSLGELTSETALPDGADRVERRYVNAFPSAGLTYNLNQTNSFSARYSRRIDRPNYQALNPFESKLDELTYQKGNAFLRPQYTSTIEVAHTYKYKLTTSLSYSDTEDFFTEITDTSARSTDGRPRNFITTRNLARQRVISLNVSYPFSIAKWWNVYLNVSAYHSVNRANFGEGKQIGLAANVLSLFVQQTITLPRGWSAEVSAFYTSPSIWGGTFRNRRFWGSTVAVQHKVFAQRGNVVLTVTDPFNAQRWRGVSQFGGLYMDASGGWESQQVRMNFSYTFGNKQIKAARRRTTGAEDEAKRL